MSPRLRAEFDNGRTYYELEGQQLLAPPEAGAAPDPELLEWHSQSVFRAG